MNIGSLFHFGAPVKAHARLHFSVTMVTPSSPSP